MSFFIIKKLVCTHDALKYRFNRKVGTVGCKLGGKVFWMLDVLPSVVGSGCARASATIRQSRVLVCRMDGSIIEQKVFVS